MAEKPLPGVTSYTTSTGEHRWRIRYEDPNSADGQRRQRARRGFTTLREANRAMREARASVDEGTYVAPSDMTVRGFVDEWLAAREPAPGESARGHRGKLGIATWDAYKRDLQTYVVPRIGWKRLQKVTPADLDALYDELERSGARGGKPLGAKTLRNLHGVLHKLLADAVKRDLIKRNPADVVEPPKADRAQTEVWSPEQLGRFLHHVELERFRAAWLLFATTGMRRGEVAGLSWQDIGFDAGELTIDWTLGVVDKATTWKRRSKSQAGDRTMSLDPATLEALRAWRKQQSEERMLAGPSWVTRNEDWRGEWREDCVFTWPDGEIVKPGRWTDWFAKHCDAAGLPRIRLHDVRHSYASAGLANARGWHEVKLISQRLGHASIGITLDTYSHVLPSQDREVADTLAAAILGGE